MGAEKTLGRLLSGTADAAIRFDDLCQLRESLGFEKRVRGSHHFPNGRVTMTILYCLTGMGDQYSPSQPPVALRTVA